MSLDYRTEKIPFSFSQMRISSYAIVIDVWDSMQKG